MDIQTSPVPRYERRLVPRRSLDALDVTWTVPGRSRWRRDKAESVTLIDLSITGGQVDAPTADRVDRGTTVVLDVDGNHISCRVRRVDHGADRSRYGLEFIDIDPHVREFLVDVARAWEARDEVEAAS